jgi:hypothetical protein
MVKGANCSMRLDEPELKRWTMASAAIRNAGTSYNAPQLFTGEKNHNHDQTRGF